MGSTLTRVELRPLLEAVALHSFCLPVGGNWKDCVESVSLRHFFSHDSCLSAVSGVPGGFEA